MRIIQPIFDDFILARIVTSKIYGQLSHEDIVAVLQLNYNAGTHREQYLDIRKQTYTTETVEHNYTRLLTAKKTEEERWEYLWRQSLLLESHRVRELIHIKAGLDRIKKPEAERRMELSWLDYVQSLPVDELDKATAWAIEKSAQAPKW